MNHKQLLLTDSQIELLDSLIKNLEFIESLDDPIDKENVQKMIKEVKEGVRELIKEVISAKKVRGFELIEKYANAQDLLPKRETAHSAGYDIKAAATVTIEPGQIALVPTGLKVYMQSNEVLYLYDRSSNPRKQGIVLTNSVGVIDSDYYNNPDNEGHIFGQFTNITDQPITIEAGTRIMQGVFSSFEVADGDEASGQRMGGFGSTSK